jgi:hypothetical protein
MSRLAKVMLVAALGLAGLPVGMPVASVATCPQCLPPAGVVCLPAAPLVTAIALWVPYRSGKRPGWLQVWLRKRLWARPLDRPPQAPPRFA